MLNHADHANFDVSISGNSEIIAVGFNDGNHIFISINAGTNFTFLPDWIELDQIEGWHLLQLQLSSIDITSDGQWMVAAGNSNQGGSVVGGVIAMTYDPHRNVFSNWPPSNFGPYSSNAVEITDDHMWFIVGQSNGVTILYHFNGTNYIESQSLSPNSHSIASLSLTNDHQYLAIGYEEGHEVLIYQYVNDSFSPLQTLHFESSSRRGVQLSHDHRHLLVAHRDGLVEVYQFGNHSFELAASWGELLAKEAVRDAQMDAEQQLVAVATDRDTYILSMPGTDATLHSLQTLNHSSHRLQFSADRQHLLTTAEGVVNIFRN